MGAVPVCDNTRKCIAMALPINNAPLEGVSRIASQPCLNDQNPQASPILTSTIASTQTDFSAATARRFMNELKIELNEAADIAHNTSVTIRQWASLLDSRNRQKIQDYLRNLQIPVCQHNTLSADVNSKLRLLEQLSSYAYFLMKQENDAAYDAYGMNGTALIKSIRIKIIRSVCILRGLLPLSGDEIKNFVQQDVAGHLIPMETMNAVSAVKRAVCSIAVNMMVETLKRIGVSVNSGFIRMLDNV